MSEHSPLARDESLGYQVNHLARLLEHHMRERIAPFGVVPGQFAQLLALYETDGLTQTELCARVQIEQPTMANTLARMERDGLITREPDPDDRRRSRVRLTPHARQIEPELIAAARTINAQATRGLSDEERTTFLDSLAVVIANLDPIGATAVGRARGGAVDQESS